MANVFENTFLAKVKRKELDNFFGRFLNLKNVKYSVAYTPKGKPFYVVSLIERGKLVNEYYVSQFNVRSKFLETSLFENFDDIQASWIKYLNKLNYDVKINDKTYKEALQFYVKKLYAKKAYSKEQEINEIINN